MIGWWNRRIKHPNSIKRMDPFSQHSYNPSFFVDSSSSSTSSMANIHINYNITTGQDEGKKKNNYKKKKTLTTNNSNVVNNNNNIKAAKDAAVMKLSTDPQSVAARERRHRISERFKILQSLIPGGAKLDTVSMLEEAIQYVKFLKSQIWLHQNMINNLVVSSSSSSSSCSDHVDCMINGDYDHLHLLHPHHRHQTPPPPPQQLQLDFSKYEEEDCYYNLVDQMEAMLPDQHHHLMFP